LVWASAVEANSALVRTSGKIIVNGAMSTNERPKQTRIEGINKNI